MSIDYKLFDVFNTLQKEGVRAIVFVFAIASMPFRLRQFFQFRC